VEESFKPQTGCTISLHFMFIHRRANAISSWSNVNVKWGRYADTIFQILCVAWAALALALPCCCSIPPNEISVCHILVNSHVFQGFRKLSYYRQTDRHDPNYIPSRFVIDQSGAHKQTITWF